MQTEKKAIEIGKKGWLLFFNAAMTLFRRNDDPFFPIDNQFVLVRVFRKSSQKNKNNTIKKRRERKQSNHLLLTKNRMSSPNDNIAQEHHLAQGLYRNWTGRRS